MTIHWKTVEQYFTVILFVFQFSPGCNFGKFVNFGLGTVRSEFYAINVANGILYLYFTCDESDASNQGRV